MRGVGGMILKTMWGFEHIIMYIRERDSDAVRGGWGTGRVNKGRTKHPCHPRFNLLYRD